MPWLDHLARRAARPSAPWYSAAAALLLSLPSLVGGLALDDHVLAQHLAQGAPWWDLFSFVEPDQVRAHMERGTLGWWADPELKLRFFRPLSSGTHALDFTLWPGAPWLMHLVSALAYAAVVALVGHLHRRWLGATATAGLATLLFAIDAAHGQTVGWLATRNTILATGLGFAALWAHDRWRREGWRPGRGLGPLLLLGALLAAEAGLAAGGYLLAHALLLDRGSWRQRLGALVPYALVAGLWRVAYVEAGYGAAASGVYLDAGADPLGFVLSIGRTVGLLGFSQLTVPVASILGLSTHGWQLPTLGFAVLLWLLWPVLGHDREARFLALGMVLASVPFAATLPTDRLLLPLGLGGSGLIARVLTLARARVLTPRRVRPLAHLMLALHLVVAPLLFVPFSLATNLLEISVRHLTDAIPDRPRVVLVNVPLEVMLLYPPAIREGRGQPWPEPVVPLYAGQTELTLRRTGSASLQLHAPAGWMPSAFNRLTRAAGRPIAVGTRVELPAATIEVLEVNRDGRPTRVSARFDRPLEAYQWVVWSERQPRSWSPPPVGEHVTVSGRWR